MTQTGNVRGSSLILIVSQRSIKIRNASTS